MSANRGMHLGHIAKASVSSPIQAAFDGKYVWVTNSGQTKVFEVWANSTADMGIDPERKVTEVASVSVLADNQLTPYGNLNDCSFITYGGGYMWIAMKMSITKENQSWGTPNYFTDRSAMLYNTILKVNVQTRIVEEVIRTPISKSHIDSDAPYQHTKHQYVLMNSVLTYAEGKLWCVDDYVDAIGTGSHSVYCYDTTSGLWSTRSFSAKTQKNRVQSCTANGIVYFSAFNSASVLKYNATTGNFINAVKGNAEPNAVCPTPSGKVMVTSYNGLISYLNTDDTWEHTLIAETDACSGIAYESDSFCWVVDGNLDLFRVGSDNYVYGTKYTTEDYEILTANTLGEDLELASRTDLSTSPLWVPDIRAIQGDMIDLNYNSLNKYSFSGSIDYCLIIPNIAYEKWNGTAMADTSTSNLLVLLTDSEVVVINTSEIKFGFPRPAILRSTMSAVGVGMISFGSNDYTGD